MSNQAFFQKNYYQLFNVSNNATAQDIKYAYAKLIRQYTNETHPEEFMHIRKAYSTLANPSQRADYDDMLNGNNRQAYEQKNRNQQQRTEQTYQRQSEPKYTYRYERREQRTNQNNHRKPEQRTYQAEQRNQSSYQNSNNQTYQRQQTHQQQTYQQQQTRNKPDKPGLFSVFIFGLILSFIFTPVVGIIAGIIVYVFNIRIGQVLGCLFWIVVGFIGLGILLEFL